MVVGVLGRVQLGQVDKNVVEIVDGQHGGHVPVQTIQDEQFPVLSKL